MNRIKCLSANVIKILACLLMAVDHVGFVLFPKIKIFRAIARPAFPLFAFLIAEGCAYTRNKFKHFVLIFALGCVCQIVYSAFTKDYYNINVLITFSLSILLIYELDYVKKSIFSAGAGDKVVSITLFALSLVGVCLLCFLIKSIYLDYGLFGVLLPLFISLFDFRRVEAPEKVKRLDNFALKLFMTALGSALLYFSTVLGYLELLALLAIPVLACYNGKRGKYNLKYLFYVFYPLHFLIIEGIYLILR